MNPSEGNIWSTYIMAHYRDGNWQAAMEGSRKVDELGFQSGTTYLFAAMINWQLGHHDVAREQFDSACRWIDQHDPGNTWMPPLRKEADQLILEKSGISAVR